VPAQFARQEDRDARLAEGILLASLCLDGRGENPLPLYLAALRPCERSTIE
jgi:hypothetical protein